MPGLRLRLRLRLRYVALAAALVTSACGFSSPSPTATPSPTPQPVPPGTYGVVTTNKARLGATYKVFIISAGGQVVAQATAALPRVTPSVPLPLVSISNTRVYYLDGDSQIRSLAPDGTTAAVTKVSISNAAIVAFSVSPDDARIAVARITEPADVAQTAGQGYVEDLGTHTHHTTIFSARFLFPVGWHGSDLVEAVGSPDAQQCVACPGAAASLELVNPADGSVLSALCLAPATQPTGGFSTAQLEGSVVPGGVACLTARYTFATSVGNGALLGEDWLGHQTTFVGTAPGTYIPYHGYALAPDGSAVACNADSGGALVLLSSTGGSPHVIGPSQPVLGWINPARLLVTLDGGTVGVVTVASGETVVVPLAGADGAAWAGLLPGGL